MSISVMDKFNVKLLLQKLEFSKIIGKKGQTIKHIRDFTGVSIVGTDLANELKLFTLFGTSLQILNAFVMISEILEQHYLFQAPTSTTADTDSFTSSNNNNHVTSNATLSNNGSCFTINLLFDHSKIGRIIGIQGAALQQIRVSSKVRSMVVEKEPKEYDGAFLRKIIITGGLQAIQSAFLLILQQLEHSTFASSQQQAAQQTLDNNNQTNSITNSVLSQYTLNNTVFYDQQTRSGLYTNNNTENESALPAQHQQNVAKQPFTLSAKAPEFQFNPSLPPPSSVTAVMAPPPGLSKSSNSIGNDNTLLGNNNTIHTSPNVDAFNSTNNNRYNIEEYPDIDAINNNTCSSSTHQLLSITHPTNNHINNNTINSNNKRPRSLTLSPHPPPNDNNTITTQHESLPLPSLISHGVKTETVRQLMDMQEYLKNYFGLDLLITRDAPAAEMSVDAANSRVNNKHKSRNNIMNEPNSISIHSLITQDSSTHLITQDSSVLASETATNNGVVNAPFRARPINSAFQMSNNTNNNNHNNSSSSGGSNSRTQSPLLSRNNTPRINMQNNNNNYTPNLTPHTPSSSSSFSSSSSSSIHDIQQIPTSSLLFFIPTNTAGGVIGKRSCNLQALQVQYNVRIYIEKETVPGIREVNISCVPGAPTAAAATSEGKEAHVKLDSGTSSARSSSNNNNNIGTSCGDDSGDVTMSHDNNNTLSSDNSSKNTTTDDIVFSGHHTITSHTASSQHNNLDNTDNISNNSNTTAHQPLLDCKAAIQTLVRDILKAQKVEREGEMEIKD